MKVDPGALDDMILWARSRIAECRRQEEKFGHFSGGKGMSQALIEAWQERHTLQAVLKQIGVDERGPNQAEDVYLSCENGHEQNRGGLCGKCKAPVRPNQERR